MNAVTWIHLAGGLVALGSGAVALAVRKGGSAHVHAGKWFVAAMVVLGVTASILGPLKTPPDSPFGGLMVCYLVATAWWTARQRDGTAGAFEKIACVVGLAMSGLLFYAARSPAFGTEPPGPVGLTILGTIFLLAGLGDLRFVLRGTLPPRQRIARHLWRMCFALFVATGSFFLGQMDVLPSALRVLPLLLVLGFAPLPLLLFWLVRVRYSRRPLTMIPEPAPLAPADHGP